MEWVAISYSRRFSLPRDQTHVSCVSCSGRQILHHCTIWEALKHEYQDLNLYNIKRKFYIYIYIYTLVCVCICVDR